MDHQAAALSKFIQSKDGPITTLQSAPFPSRWRWRTKLWYSVAHLHPRWQDPARVNDVLAFGGGGWAENKFDSQCKAIVEAVERWAVQYYKRQNPAYAGLDLDPTSNGFAAIPRYLPHLSALQHAYLEAIERWVLSNLWDQEAMTLRRQPLPLGPSVVVSYINKVATIHNFEATIKIQAVGGSIPSQSAYFSFVLCALHEGGIVPGSACRLDAKQAHQHALLEAFNHLRALSSVTSGKKGIGDSITDKRLLHFGTSVTAKEKILYQTNHMVGTGMMDGPLPTFFKVLDGPWNPDIQVARVLVADSEPITSGDINRFVI